MSERSKERGRERSFDVPECAVTLRLLKLN